MDAGADREPPLVLVADDDRVTRDYVAGLLRGRSFRVETVGDGTAAIDRAAKGGVDLVILDRVMPNLSGIDCLRVLKARADGVFLPVLLLTSRNDADSRVEGLRLGADDYLGKPFDERELIARVENLLRMKTVLDDARANRARVEAQSLIDEHTGLFNARYLETRLSEEFARAERHREPLAMAMLGLDVDRSPDQRLSSRAEASRVVELAERVRRSMRESDVLARADESKLAILLPSTHFSGAITVAERIWRGVASEPFLSATGTSTVSVGLGLFPGRDIRTKEHLHDAAHHALERARDEGGDRICVIQHREYIYRPATIPPKADS